MGPTQVTIQWVSVALSLGVKRQGFEADYSPLASVVTSKAIPVTGRGGL
jgi:hypothetical protein